MSRRAERLIRSFGLPEIESDYLRAVDRSSRSLTGITRRRLVTETADILGERPLAASSEELERALGSPGAFVAELRQAEGLAAVASPLQRWREQRARTRVGQLVLLLILVAGVVTYRSYYGATADIHNSCGGMIATGQTSASAAGVTEYIAAYRPNRRIGVFVCLHTRTSGVTVERIYRANDTNYNLTAQVGWELERDPNGGFRGDASSHRRFDPQAANGLLDAIVWFETAFCSNDGLRGMGSIAVDYTYRGRSKTTVLDLGSVYTVDSDEQCTDEARRADDIAEHAWERAVEATGRQGDDFGAMPYELWPPAVSFDLCRYLRGVEPPLDPDGGSRFEDFEPLDARVVFQVTDRSEALALIDGAVLGICPEFAGRREELHGLVVTA